MMLGYGHGQYGKTLVLEIVRQKYSVIYIPLRKSVFLSICKLYLLFLLGLFLSQALLAQSKNVIPKVRFSLCIYIYTEKGQ